MNWIFLVLGIPAGMLAGILGEKLARKVKNGYLKGIVRGTPLTILISAVIIIDLLL